MNRIIRVDARWIADDDVWIATSEQVPGLVVEGPNWTEMIREVRLLAPDLLELAGQQTAATLVFRAEERFDVAAA